MTESSSGNGVAVGTGVVVGGGSWVGIGVKGVVAVGSGKGVFDGEAATTTAISSGVLVGCAGGKVANETRFSIRLISTGSDEFCETIFCGATVPIGSSVARKSWDTVAMADATSSRVQPVRINIPKINIKVMPKAKPCRFRLVAGDVDSVVIGLPMPAQ